MCFAPHRCALFHHLNFQKCSEHGVLCTFSLRNVLRATTACTFLNISTSKSAPNLASKCASRHNGVQFFISHLARWLRTRRFSEPTFRPSGATNHWKNTVFRDFAIFSRPASSVFCLFLFSDLLSSSVLFSDSSHLCFFICPHICIYIYICIVGSLTSKLPSVTLCEVQGFCW